jgi:outer membrane protein assembly factor BamB
LLWSKSGQTWDRLPTILERGADGSIWGTDGEVFWYKIDPSTGETIWRKTFGSLGSNGARVDDFVLIPGSENIVAVGYPEIQRWEPDPWKPNELYRLEVQQTIAGDVSTRELAQTPSGVAYTFDAFRGHEVYRFSTETLKVTPLKKYPFKIQDMALPPMASCCWLLATIAH